MKTILDKAIKSFGFENPITITIALLIEQGRTELAKRLYGECIDLYLSEAADDDEEPLEGLTDEEYDEYLDEADETGSDPYEGCYTFDC